MTQLNLNYPYQHGYIKKIHIFLTNLDGILYGRSNHSKFKFEHWQVKRCPKAKGLCAAVSHILLEMFLRLPALVIPQRCARLACRPWLRAVRSLLTFRAQNPPPILGAFLDADGSAVRQSHPSTPPPTPSSISPLSAVTTLCMLKEDVIDSFFPF